MSQHSARRAESLATWSRLARLNAELFFGMAHQAFRTVDVAGGAKADLAGMPTWRAKLE